MTNEWKPAARPCTSTGNLDIRAGDELITVVAAKGWGYGACASPATVKARAALIAAAVNSYRKHYGARAVQCAEADFLAKTLDALRNLATSARTFRNVPGEQQQWTSFDDAALENAFALLAEVDQPTTSTAIEKSYTMTDTVKAFTNEDADRLLQLADQFLSDWAEDAVQAGERDVKYEQRRDEWNAIRPILAAAPETAARCERLAADNAALKSALQGVLDSLTQNKTYPADVENARRLARQALGNTAPHPYLNPSLTGA